MEDSSLLRRGFPVAHSIFGTAQTINSSNYIYFQALQEVTKLNSSEAVEIYTGKSTEFGAYCCSSLLVTILTNVFLP